MFNVLYSIFGRISFLFTIGLSVPFLYTIIFQAGELSYAFSYTILICIGVGLFCHAKAGEYPETLSVASGAAFMFFSWIFMAALGMFPYIFADVASPAQAFMESISGFTTTGVTSIGHDKNAAIILWRSITQWIGGLCLLMQLVNIMPVVAKGFGIFYAVPIRFRHNTISMKRIKGSVLRLISIYSLATFAGVMLLYLCGTRLFDAINFMMVIISTGGCYKVESLDFLSVPMLIVLGIAAFFASQNILVYMESKTFLQLKQSFKYTIHSFEMRVFTALSMLSVVLIAAYLYKNDYDSAIVCLGHALLSVASFASTTGVFLSGILDWPELTKMLLVLMAVVGGCIGSLAGGFKMLRVIILLKSSWAELRRTLHPKMVLNIKVDNGSVPNHVVNRIFSFFFMYVVIIFFSMMIISLSGCSMLQSMYAAIGCLTSTGQMFYFHLSSEQIHDLPAWTHIFCCFLMILGKVEIFAFLVLIQSCIKALSKDSW